MTLGMTGLTPVEERGGWLVKREDLYRAPNGVNGAKYRACQHLIGSAYVNGARHITTAASVLSPQHAIVATVAREFGLTSTHVVGASKPHTAAKHPSVAEAMRQGAEFRYISCAYNASLQPAARRLAAERGDAYMLHYGITTPPDATVDEVRAFAEVGARQVRNIPPATRRIIMPFGSANSSVGVLYGLAQMDAPPEVHLMGIGPDRREWALDRLRRIGADTNRLRLHHHDLTGRFRYGDKARAELDGIALHPTYEAKILTWIRETRPAWAEPALDTLFWIVGGPLA